MNRILGMLLIGTALITGCETESQADALDMMELVFDGNHSRDEIKRRIELGMNLYDVPITEENYQRAGSALVEMRKSTGVTEMELLTCAIEAHAPAVEITFPEAVGICATLLVK